jgi:hypothetical protein
MKTTTRLAAAIAALVVPLTGCYVVPVTGPDGTVQYHHYPLPPAGTPAATTAGTYSAVPAGPATLAARLYPQNDIATQTGVVSGSVTNLMSGKGRFMVEYQGELLSGEATRVSNDERRGVASAYSPKGMYMSCEYQMNTPYQGAGTCTFSNGAKYQLHIGGR